MSMKVTDYIVHILCEHGVETVFGYTGGSIADLVHSIYSCEGIRFVQNYHEQASSLSANAYAQLTGKTGVAISSSGPGAINLINGIANAYFDSIPCIFITGNVATYAQRENPQIRQNAFQETDIVALAKSITKYSVSIQDESMIGMEIDKAFYVANEGRKGPVLIDIPYDIQRKDIDISMLDTFCPPAVQFTGNQNQILFISQLMKESKRPLILIGGGCQNLRSKLRIFLEKFQIPSVASLRGIDVVPATDPNYVGYIGSYGNRSANLAVRYCDFLLVLGSRLDERQMGYPRENFAPDACIVQVDIDSLELGRKTENLISICAPVEWFLQKSIEVCEAPVCQAWRKLLKRWKTIFDLPSSNPKSYRANNFLRYLSEIADDNAIFTVDVGQNQMISAQSLKLKQGSRFLSSSGLACMGYSLPAAIGACYAAPNRQVISINGDGGIQMNIQELQTICREQLPIKIIILNNHCLGLIRKLQENMFNRNYYASVDGYSAPDFEKLASAYGLPYYRVSLDQEYQTVLSFLPTPGAAVIDVELPVEMETFPEPGTIIYEQKPELSEKTKINILRQIEECEKI